MKKKVLALLLAFAMMFPLFANATLTFAAGEEYSASSVEVPAFAADKAFDGLYNRFDKNENKSRWASEARLATEENPHWLQVKYAEPKTAKVFKIHWERTNVNAYQIQSSNDGQEFTTLYSSDTPKRQFIETIVLPEAVTAQYFRVVITSHTEGGDCYELDGSITNIEWPTVSIYEFQIFEEGSLKIGGEDENLFLGQTVTATDEETADFAAENLVDGSTLTRWATTKNEKPVSATIELENLAQLQSIQIDWERSPAEQNILKFDIKVSEDGNQWFPWYAQNQRVNQNPQMIVADHPLNAKYIKLTITDFDGGTNDWPNVGICEISGFSGPKTPTLPEVITSLDDLNTLPFNEDKTQVVIPEIDGADVSIIGSNADQVIDLSGKIHQPLQDKNVRIMLQSVKGEDVEKKEFFLTVPGKYVDTGLNDKPSVIPALQEWYGGEGNILIDTTAKIEGDEEFNLAKAEFKKDLKDYRGIEITEGSGAKFRFVKDTKDEFKDEGYGINITDSEIVITAQTNTGAFYATRTLLQMMKQYEDELPLGQIRDYPKYPVRGFMLDVGRKFTDMEYLYQYLKNMSYYKMNDFQLHLNDNELWLEYLGSTENAIENGYAGFRLESETYPDITSKDGYYTKAEFKRFINEARDLYGVRVVPEFDAPGHALSFVKVQPELYYKGRLTAGKVDNERVAMLDLTDERTVPFIKSVYDEYLEEDGTFSGTPIFHVGTDEYYGDKETYRSFVDTILTYTRSKNKTPRLWGSLSQKNGSTPINPENAQMHIWNYGWANPKKMVEQGFHVINILDGHHYIVPKAGYYKDYLDNETLYNTFDPAVFVAGGSRYTIEESNPLFLGAQYALWNDQTGYAENGIMKVDMFDRIYHSLAVYSQLYWGSEKDYSSYEEFKAVANRVGLDPTSNPYFQVDTVDSKVFGYNFLRHTRDLSGNGRDLDLVNAEDTSRGLQLNGGRSYATTGIKNVGYPAVLEMNVTLEEKTTEPQILFETTEDGDREYACEKYGTVYAIDENGKIGFDNGWCSYSFDTELEVGVRTKLLFVMEQEKTTLYVNGEKVDILEDEAQPDKHQNTSLIFPVERIGAEENAFIGKIASLKMNSGAFEDESIVKPVAVSANSEEIENASAKEGPIELAFDGDSGTFWHTVWTGGSYPFIVDIDLGKPYQVVGLDYLPRQTGDNGIVTGYKVFGSLDGEEYTEITSGSWAFDRNLKTAELTGTYRHIRFQVDEAVTDQAPTVFASAAEITIRKYVAPTVDKSLLEAVIEQADATDLTGKTEESVQKFNDAKKTAKEVFADEKATQKQVDDAELALSKAIEGLVTEGEEPVEPTEVDKSDLDKAIQTAESIDLTGKTQETAQALLNEIAKAKLVQKDLEATQEQVDRAVAALIAAMDGLKDVEEPIEPTKEGFITEDGNTYFYENGQPVKGEWRHFGDRSYFFRAGTGTMVKGWQYIDGHWRFFRDSGTMVKSRWEWLDKKWKFFNSKGQSMDQFWEEKGKVWLSQAGPTTDYCKGWKTINGLRYFFRKTSGTRVEGWQYIDGYWRFFRKGSGTQAFGWQFIDGHWYYLRENTGTRVMGRQYIDGRWYEFRGDGTLKGNR